MNPEHDGQGPLYRPDGRDDIEEKAVFAAAFRIVPVPVAEDWLCAGSSERRCIAHAGPRLNRDRLFPAQSGYGWLGVGDTEELCPATGPCLALKLACGSAHDKGIICGKCEITLENWNQGSEERK